MREAVAKYIGLRLTEGLDPAGDTHAHLEKHLLKRFCAVLGGISLRQLLPDHIRIWSSNLKDDVGEKFSPVTVRHHLVSVKTFCKRAHAEGWSDRNPSVVIVLPDIEEKPVNVLPVRSAFEFFRVNRDARAIGRVALEAFGGVRYTTAGKLDLAEIKFDQLGIDMPSRKHKSSRRKFRQGHPENLWEWLEQAPDACWNLTLRQYREEKKEMHIRANLRPLVPKTPDDHDLIRELYNVHRHNFATYLLAKTKNYQPVSYLMQHTNAQTTERYEGVATESDALLYFAITPDSTKLSWEDFYASHQPKQP